MWQSFKVASGRPRDSWFWDFENSSFESCMRVLRFFIFSRKLRIWFCDFSNFIKIWKYGFEVSNFFAPAARKLFQFLKEIVDLPLKYTKIFACGAKICVRGFQIFRKFTNFETNVLRFFKNFQISSQGFKVLSLKFPNLRQWFWDFSPAAQFGQGGFNRGGGGFRFNSLVTWKNSSYAIGLVPLESQT